MSIRQHVLVEDSNDADTVVPQPIEYDMSSMLHALQLGTYQVATPTNLGSIRKFLQAILQIAEVTLGLLFTPGLQSEFKNRFQIGRCQSR